MIGYKNKGTKIFYILSFIHKLLIILLVTDIPSDTAMNKTDTIHLHEVLFYGEVSNTVL